MLLCYYCCCCCWWWRTVEQSIESVRCHIHQCRYRIVRHYLCRGLQRPRANLVGSSWLRLFHRSQHPSPQASSPSTTSSSSTLLQSHTQTHVYAYMYVCNSRRPPSPKGFARSDLYVNIDFTIKTGDIAA